MQEHFVTLDKKRVRFRPFHNFCYWKITLIPLPRMFEKPANQVEKRMIIGRNRMRNKVGVEYLSVSKGTCCWETCDCHRICRPFDKTWTLLFFSLWIASAEHSHEHSILSGNSNWNFCYGKITLIPLPRMFEKLVHQVEKQMIIRRNTRRNMVEVEYLSVTGKSFSEACNICRTWCVPKLFWMSKQNKSNNLCTQHVLQVFWAYNFHEQWTICRHIVG